MFSVLYGVFSVPLFVVWMTHTEQQGKTCQIADIQMTLSDAQIWKIIFLYHFSEQPKLHAAEWGFWEVTGALWGQPKQSYPAVLSPGMRLMQIPKALPWFLSFCSSPAKTDEGKRVNTIWYYQWRVYKDSSKTYHRIEKLKRIKSLQWLLRLHVLWLWAAAFFICSKVFNVTPCLVQFVNTMATTSRDF